MQATAEQGWNFGSLRPQWRLLAVWLFDLKGSNDFTGPSALWRDWPVVDNHLDPAILAWNTAIADLSVGKTPITCDEFWSLNGGPYQVKVIRDVVVPFQDVVPSGQ
jgi:hypothetical protein